MADESAGRGADAGLQAPVVSVAEQAIVKQRHKREQRVCALVADKDGRRTWLMVGTVQPIISKDRVRCAAHFDAPAFTWTAKATSADPQLTGREVFARAAVKLLRSRRHHTFKALASIFPSLCLLAADSRLPDDTGDHEPSWRGIPVNLSDQDCRRLLRAATTALARSGSRMVDGDVNIASSKENALDHPWFIYRLLVLRDRSTVARTVANVRGSVAFTTRTLDERVEFADTVNAADMGRVRAKTELMPAPVYSEPPVDGARKTRKRRRTMIYGATIPKSLPTSDQVRKVCGRRSTSLASRRTPCSHWTHTALRGCGTTSLALLLPARGGMSWLMGPASVWRPPTIVGDTPLQNMVPRAGRRLRRRTTKMPPSTPSC